METYLTSTLGLPPDLPVELDDSLIRQFQFISPEISQLQNEFGDFLAEFGEERSEPEIKSLRQWFRRLAGLRSRVETVLQLTSSTICKKWRNALPIRLATMTPAGTKGISPPTFASCTTA